jgi:N-methylhydantoinase B
VNPPPYGLLKKTASHLHVASPGGGGVGDPLLREVDKVVRDVRDGLVSQQQARAVYGVVMAAGTKQADKGATDALRAQLKATRMEGAQ